MKLAACLTLLGMLSHPVLSQAAVWQDLQRQYPQQSLQQLQSATLSIQVLQLPAQTAQVRGSLLVLPAAGRHPYSPDLFHTLQQLSGEGWQLVFLPAPDRSSPDAMRQASLNTELRTRWQLVQPLLQGPVVVIAQGEVAGTLHLALADDSQFKLDALVSLGAYLSDPILDSKLQQHIPQQKLPVLDLLTRADHPGAMRSAEQRQQLARTLQSPFYRQRALDEFSYHSSQQQWLLREISGWLKTSGF
jgi:hypothetical protein